MPPVSARAPALQVKSRVIHANDVVVPMTRYPIKVPKGLAADDLRMPKFVKREEMMKLRSGLDGNNPGQLASVRGLVTAAFSVTFPDIERQWQRVNAAGNRIAWSFRGGEIVLTSTISVHVLEEERPVAKDRLSQKKFALIWEHELLHVLDDIQIIRDWLPGELPKDDWVKKFLIDAQEMPDTTFDHYIRNDKLTIWLRDGPWASERNARRERRDSPANYAALSNEINTIRSQMTNR